jgi:hypothetical protein
MRRSDVLKATFSWKNAAAKCFFCDIGAIGINQLAVEGTKTCLNATIANTCL